MARWKRSGLTAAQFAVLEGVSDRTLRWWSSALRRDTRASRGSSSRTESTAIVPIEIELPMGGAITRGSRIEIAVGEVVVSAEVGTDPAYLGALCAALGGRR